ncbi:nucleotide-binding protein [Microbacterium aerolatum]|uniref:nucleotide-binding protein n=1 Tax=Microbacterium aerolatum TaxID=153731 RepID=UPI003850737A
MTTSPLPRVFIGASSEAKRAADTLQVLLQGHGACEPYVWDQGTFQLTESFLGSLTRAARDADFGVLLATQDDAITGHDRLAPRDNVMLELGLFIGALGRERAILVADHSADGIKLPTDMSGITHAPYTTNVTKNLRTALTDVALKITEHIERVGARDRSSSRAAPTRGANEASGPTAVYPASRNHVAGIDEVSKLQWELQLVAQNAQAQGWRVRNQSQTAFRVESPRRQRFTFSIAAHPRTARAELRKFVSDLRTNGLRISRAVREPIEVATGIVGG